jgi:acetyl esterase/lipase
VARALAAQGITAFVLSYRTRPMPDDEAGFNAAVMASFGTFAAQDPVTFENRPRLNPATADAITAVTWVRAHASELNVSPERVGFLGFSAGGFAAHGLVEHGPKESRPDFVGLIYAGRGADAGSWPSGAPPHFLCVAGDDPLFSATMAAFTSLRTAKVNAELHVYNDGGHGFGLKGRGKTHDHWMAHFLEWVRAKGF